MDDFDVVVLGGGPAGETLAGRCADGGLTVALANDSGQLPWLAEHRVERVRGGGRLDGTRQVTATSPGDVVRRLTTRRRSWSRPAPPPPGSRGCWPARSRSPVPGADEQLGLETVGVSPGRVVDVGDALRVRGVGGGRLSAVGDSNGRATSRGPWHAVPSFPTISEVWLRLLEQYDPVRT